MKHTIYIGMDFKPGFIRKELKQLHPGRSNNLEKYSVNFSNYFKLCKAMEQFFCFCFFFNYTDRKEIPEMITAKLTKKSNSNSLGIFQLIITIKQQCFAKQQQTTTKKPNNRCTAPPKPPNLLKTGTRKEITVNWFT